MRFCDEIIQKHLLNGGKIKRRLGSCNIIAHIGENGFIFDNSGSFYIFCEQDLTADDWEIVEDDFDWDKIIEDKILCVFSNYKDFRSGHISIVSKVDLGFFYTKEDKTYPYCKPFVVDEYNIAKKLADYQKTY